MSDEHVCVHEHRFGRIEAAMEVRKEEAAELKGQVSSVVTMLTTLQLEQSKRDNELKNDIVEIRAILNSEQERRKELASEVEQQGAMLTKLDKNMSLALAGITRLTDMHASSDKVHSTFDRRIRYLERVAWVVYVAIGAIAILGTIVAWYGSTMNNYKMLHTPQVIRDAVGNN